MMKQQLLVGALVFGSLTTAFAQGRNCASMDALHHQLSNDPYLHQRMEAIEHHTADYAQTPIQQRVNVTIPVVVHVLYNNATQNISDAQILSQIAVLNADFAGTNADASLLPAAFASARVGNTGIQFCMAKRTPTGAATTGIIRKAVTKTSFSADNDDAKATSTGGDDTWAAGQYLNLWVVPSITSGGQGGILGYAQFPGGAAATDGVVIGYQYFGNTGAVAAPYNKGRTATHEVGHWLNLRHIWGDANCGTDLVTDTPTSQTSNIGCPTYPHKTCSNTTSGDMFMNYMDYTDDACMYMFSNGQNTRVQALFATGGSRASLLTSQGCVAPTTTGCGTPSALAAASITTTTATLSWSAISGVTNYTLKYKTAAATAYTSVTVTAASYALAGLTAATTYNFTVTANCGTTVSGTSAVTNFTTLATNAVTYCTSKGTSAADEYINKVVFNTINNTSGNNAGYGNFTNLSTSVKRSTAYTITITPGWTSTVYAEGYKVWIDWNQDGDFLDAGENVFTKAASTATPATGSITVPATATLGNTRMRVQMKYNSSTITSCETFSYGEVEDYTLSVVAARESAPSAPAELGVLLYPNPAHEQLTLELTQFDAATPLTARLMNVSGAELRTLQITAATQTIEIADLPAGMYFISVIGADKQIVTKKFIKN